MKLNLIVAACKNRGIGINGKLPWKLKREMAFFTRMTTTSSENKKNAVIMGRKSWESIPIKFRPLSNRINVVISRTLGNISDDVLVYDNLDKALTALSAPPYSDQIDKVWIIGGQSIYEEALANKMCHRVYFTEIQEIFECDVFIPPIPSEFHQVSDPSVPEGMQEENGIKYEFKVYEKS